MMFMRTRIALLLLVVASVAFGGAPVPTVPGGGQSSPGTFGQLGDAIANLGKASVSYVNNRILDFFDMMELNIAAGTGAKVGVEYLVGRTTLGYVESSRLGFDGRQMGAWQEKNASFGIFPLSLVFLPFELVKSKGGVWEGLAVGGFEMGTVGVESIEREHFSTSTVLYENAKVAGPLHERPGDICSVGAEVHLILGARARVKPLEIVDFVVGFIGIDFDRALAHPRPYGDFKGTPHEWKPVKRR